MTRYDHRTIEPKWQKKWLENKIYQPDLHRAQNPFYNLFMFPYPSAEGLHVGHAFSSTGSDIYGRFQRMRSKDVFQPMGYDSFGIHSENYAIKVKEHPSKLIEKTTTRYGEQLRSLGHGYDWSHSLTTSDPDYYRWTQWIFIQLFKKGLAYRGKSKVNWCPQDKTVLADEQVIAGQCERCGSTVETRELEQWFFKITDYSDRLLENLEKIDWSQKVKVAQKNWIGKKEGAELKFRITRAGDKNLIGEELWVFTTRPDTVFGATFLVLSADHHWAGRLAIDEQTKQVEDYIAKAKRSGPIDAEEKEKSGVVTGAWAVNPVTGRDVPIWIASYVLAEYGTGSIMGVPAHDERDHAFAKAHKLDIAQVILPYTKTTLSLPYVGEGTLTKSGQYSDMPSNVAAKRIVSDLTATSMARTKTSYRLRDWLISRQRYWGPPIPMVFCKEDGWVPVNEQDLPIRLPDTDEYLPSQTGKNPLGRVDSFLKTKCPACGKEAVRSDEVSDTFLDSAWYFLRYPAVGSKTAGQAPWDPDLTKKWFPVDMYIGGAEHSVLHLLYSRFLTMVFHDLGLLHFDEPFTRFRAHGLLISEGAKMSKSKGNVVVPDAYIKAFGADTLRTYLMFIGPFEQGGDFQDRSIAGVSRFLKRVRHLTLESAKRKHTTSKTLTRDLHATIKKVTADIPSLKYNTAIAAMMEFVNAWEDEKTHAGSDIAAPFLQLLAPVAPHLTEELWVNVLKNKFSIHQSLWPLHDETVLQTQMAVIPVTVNGKVRDQIAVRSGASEAEVVAEALKREKIKHWVTKAPKRSIYVAGRVLNIVT